MSRQHNLLVYDRSRRMTVAEAALYLRCSESWVRKLIASGQLQAVRIGSRKGLQVSLSSVKEYLRQQEEKECLDTLTSG